MLADPGTDPDRGTWPGAGAAADVDGAGALRVLVVAHYASDLVSGEASIPLHVFRRLRAAGVEAWLLTHESFRDELADLAAAEPGRLHFNRGLPGGSTLLRWSERLPDGPRSLAWALTQLERQVAMWPHARRLVRRHRVDVVHQPVGVAPSVPSAMAALGAPVVVGPLNGGMSLPRDFAGRERRSGRLLRSLRRPVNATVHWVVPGRRRARVVLVANERTRALLPRGLCGEVRVLSEIGVVLDRWPYEPAPHRAGRLRAVYVGRLVDWKAVDLLLAALRRVPDGLDVTLEVVGDGPERPGLEEFVRRAGLEGRVHFAGWLPPDEAAAAVRRSDVLVLTSLREAGGAVLLEAMATGRPVIASRWGGPAELVPPGAGLLVTPRTPEQFVAGIADALATLARDPEARRRMGEVGRRHVERSFDWDELTRRLVAAYRAAAGPAAGTPARPQQAPRGAPQEAAQEAAPREAAPREAAQEATQGVGR